MSDTSYPVINGNGADIPQLKYKDQGDGSYALAVYAVNGAGGAGSSMSDVLLTDSNNVLFIGRDNGTSITFIRIDNQSVYTPVGTIKAAGNNVVTVADGADTTQGAITDAAVAAGASGSISAKLRAISRDIGSFLSQLPASLGLKASAASLSVVQASDDAQFGTEATGFVASTGATGVRGRLSEISTAVRALNQDVSASGALSAAAAAVTLTNLNDAASAYIQITGTYVGVIQFQTSPDNGTTWQTQLLVSDGALAAASATLASAAVGSWKASVAGASQARVLMNTYTSGTANVVLRVSGAPMTPVGDLKSVNLSQVAGATALTLTNPGGSSGAVPIVGIASTTSFIAYNAQDWHAATTLTSTSTVNDSGCGIVSSFLVNVSAYTAGSSTGLDIFVQYSPDNGTNWISIWQLPRITAAGNYDVPPLYLPGRYRFAYLNSGAASTTATVTVTATRISMPVRPSRQFFDRAANLTSSTATAGNAGTSYDIAGCSNVTYKMVQGTASGPASYQIALSDDGVNFALVGSPVAAAASTTTAVSVSGIAARYCRLQVTTTATSQAPTVFCMAAN